MNQNNPQGLAALQAQSLQSQALHSQGFGFFSLGQASNFSSNLMGFHNPYQHNLSVIEKMRKEVAEYLKDWKE